MSLCCPLKKVLCNFPKNWELFYTHRKNPAVNQPLSSSPCRPSCITDRNQLHGLNVGQLFRPPPFVTFDPTTLPLAAPIRLLHLGDVTPIYPVTVRFTRCDIGALSGAHTVGWHSLPLFDHPNYGAFWWKAAVLSLWSRSLQNKTVESKKRILWKGNLPHNVSKALLTTPPLYKFL